VSRVAVRRTRGLYGGVDLEDAYAAAWDEWFESLDSEFWDSAIGDGLDPA